MTYYNSQVDHGGDTTETLEAIAKSIEHELDTGVAAVKALCEAEDICLSDVVYYLAAELEAIDKDFEASLLPDVPDDILF